MRKRMLKVSSLLVCVILAITFLPFRSHAAGSDIVPVEVTGEFRQTNARKMLSMINDFRTGSEAWYWNEDDETKTTYAPGQLGKLTYDYDLEKVAMQRAAEISLYYSHTRPDGSRCFDLTINGTRSYGENIALGYESETEVFVAWREDDDSYNGQGHRRNMLREGYTAVGFGCFCSNGILYWVQEFGYSNSGAQKTAANDSAAALTIDNDRTLAPYLPDLAPQITAQPAGKTVQAGKTATFSVTAEYVYGPILYQWYYRTSGTASWQKVQQNGTSATYKLSTRARHNGYQYTCFVRNPYGIVWTEVVTLKVKDTPLITTQPKSVTVTEGKTATFSVTATGAESYQWYYRTSGTADWQKVLNNGTSATYKLSTKARHNGYQYRCKLTNKNGSVYTSTVKLTVKCKPVITAQPSDVTVKEGKTATFKVTATGAESYQWYYRTSSTADWQKVLNNGTSATYKLSTKARHNGYQYRCKVTNANGSVYTKTVKLTVN